MRDRPARPPADARETALRLLAVHERSRAEVGARLREKGFPPAEVEAVLARLVETGLIDDRRFAGLRARALAQRGQGPRRIEADLRARGVADAVIAAALLEAQEGVPTAERMRALVVRRFGEGCLEAGAEPGLRGRAQRYLLQKGFSADEVLALFDR